MKNILNFAAVGETTMGLALLFVPSSVGQLLFGERLAGTGILLGRFTGIALIALGVACWPVLRGDQDAKTYCLTRGRYPTSGCCLSEMLPLPHALATEHLDLFISQ